MIRLVLRISQQTGGPAATPNAAQAARNAAEAQANADRAIENAIQAAERAAQSVGEDVPPPAAPPTDAQSPVKGISFGEGQPEITADFVNGSLVLHQGGNTTTVPWRDAVPTGVVQIAWAIPATLSILLIWWPLSRAVIRWINRKNVSNNEATALEARMRDRFETLERNLDTVAVEMERLSEGQRFTNKLLAERAEKERVPVSGQA